jgi:hypothetical protein
VSASGAGSLGVGSSRADGSGAGVAAAGFGLCLTVLADLIMQNQLYHYTNQKGQNVHYAKRCTLRAKTSS